VRSPGDVAGGLAALPGEVLDLAADAAYEIEEASVVA